MSPFHPVTSGPPVGQPVTGISRVIEAVWLLIVRPVGRQGIKSIPEQYMYLYHLNLYAITDGVSS